VSDCILTTNRYLDKDGYPRAKFKGRSQPVHRIMYELIHGEIPAGGVIGHYCNNTGCVNPTHHYLTTAAENSSHAARDGLYRTGFNNHKTKLSPQDKIGICDEYASGNYTQRELSLKYQISQSRVSEIIKERYADDR